MSRLVVDSIWKYIYHANALDDEATTEDYNLLNVAIPFINHFKQQLLTQFYELKLMYLHSLLCYQN